MGRLSGIYFKIFLWVMALIIVVFVGLGLFLSKGKVLSERHTPFEYTKVFDYKSSDFDQYIAYAQDYLRSARIVAPSEDFIKNASPFVLEPSSECERSSTGRFLNGIVLTHGLIASPYSMRPIAEYFQSRCFYVLSVLLPEHASRPGDFKATRWQRWVEVQRFAIKELQKKADSVFLSGHSVGGELAVYEAALNTEVKGLILFTPAMQITPAAKYARYVSWLGWLFHKAAWYEVREDVSLYRYESITFSAAKESYGLIQATNKALAARSLNIPIFTVASVEDNTVDTHSILSFMAQHPHPLSQILLYSQHPVTASGNVKVYPSAAPGQGVLSVSHLGIMLPASHPEYGRDGAYRSCGHYYNEPENFKLCVAGKRVFYGEVTEGNLKQGLVERIAFNPFYDDLLKDLDAFLDGL